MLQYLLKYIAMDSSYIAVELNMIFYDVWSS